MQHIVAMLRNKIVDWKRARVRERERKSARMAGIKIFKLNYKISGLKDKKRWKHFSGSGVICFCFCCVVSKDECQIENKQSRRARNLLCRIKISDSWAQLNFIDSIHDPRIFIVSGFVYRKRQTLRSISMPKNYSERLPQSGYQHVSPKWHTKRLWAFVHCAYFLFLFFQCENGQFFIFCLFIRQQPWIYMLYVICCERIYRSIRWFGGNDIR